MDPILAALYNTNVEETDKVASAEQEESQEMGDEVAGLDESQIEALAQHVLSADTEGTETEAAGEPDAEYQEKLSEADYCGRVMAHAFVQEVNSIKTANAVTEGLKKAKDTVVSKVKGSNFGKALELHREAIHIAGMAHPASMADKAGTMVDDLRKARNEALKAGGKNVAKGAAGVAAAGAVGLGAKKLMSKKSSAVDTLAEQRALEILAANGIDPNASQEKRSASPADQLAAAVEEKAVAMLIEAGYTFEE